MDGLKTHKQATWNLHNTVMKKQDNIQKEKGTNGND